MLPEDNENSKIPSRKRWVCLPSCFLSSPVSDSGGSDRIGPPTGSKTELSWFSWCRYRKKTKTVPLHRSAPSIKASSQKDSLSKKPSKARTGGSRINAPQFQREADTGLHPEIDSHQPRLPLISTHYSTRSRPAPPSRKADAVRTGIRTSHPGSPEHIHPTTSNLSPVRTGSLESAAGLWVMVVTLAVMVFFGRASAITCLCFCLYLVPLLRVAEDEASGRSGVGSREVDMDSEEHKKRVILEGLLERNGRKRSGVSVAMAPAGGTR